MEQSWHSGRSARITSTYNAVAAAYERQFLDELEAKPRDRALLDELAAHGTGAVIDLGCGPGQIGAFVGHSGRPVIGVDLSIEMATLASRRLTGAVAADVLALPLADASVGDAVAFYSLVHLPRAALLPALQELARVLTRGGWLAVSAHEGEGEAQATEFLGYSVDLTATWFELDELTNAAEGAGLEVVRAERRAPYENEGSTTRLYVVAAKA